MGRESELILENSLITSGADKGFVERAVDFAKGLCDETDLTGEGVFPHNLAVGKILADMGLGPKIIAAGLLHNAIDNCAVPAQIEKQFGKDVLELVELHHKFRKSVRGRERKAGKMLIAISQNLGFVFVELADTKANLERAGKLPAERRAWFVKAAKELYAPLAYRLGIYRMKADLEDLVFRAENPEKYREIEAKVENSRAEMEKRLEKLGEILRGALRKEGIKAEMLTRVKHIYGIYGKMLRRGKAFDEIYDLRGIRVIAKSVDDCYKVLGVAHSLWKHIPAEFDDYIMKPKENNYRSIHTTVIGPMGNPLEIQIRTGEMDRAAELGLAAHWSYKGGKATKHEKKLEWARQLLEWQRNSEEALSELINVDFFDNVIFVLTPKGDVIELPQGATPIDFAYAIHTKLGEKCEKAKVNSRLVSLNYALKNGDLVDVIISPSQKPKRAWLTFVKTEKAKLKIRQALNLQKSFEPAKKEKRRDVLTAPKGAGKIRVGKCCSPLPGDELVGFWTTKRKLSVHRKGCDEVGKMAEGRKIFSVDLGGAGGEATIELTAADRAGLLTDLLSAMSSFNAKVVGATAKTSQTNKTTCRFDVRVRDRAELEKITERLGKLPGVKGIRRI